MLGAMRTPPEVLPLAAAYLRVIFLALPSIYLYTFVMMALRGAGDSRTPFIFLAHLRRARCRAQPAADPRDGPIPALGIAGSALATLIAQWIGLVALMTWLYRSRHFLRAHPRRTPLSPARPAKSCARWWPRACRWGCR